MTVVFAIPSPKAFSSPWAAVRVRVLNRLLISLIFIAVCCAARPALAHSTSTSYLLLDVPSDQAPVGLRWDLAVQDIIWSVYIDRDYDGVVTWQEVLDARRSIESAVPGEISLSRGGVACTLHFNDLALAERAGQNYLSVSLTGECPKQGLLGVGGSLFMNGNAAQRVLLSATRGKERLTGVLSATASSWDEPAHPSAWASFARFVREGVWHVLTGYDHMAFILLLLLPSVLRPVDGRWQSAGSLSQVTRDIVTIITAFTIAHSTTLALAVTGTVHLPTQPIEVAIAASIAIAGGLNLLPRLSPLRLPLAFGFGFVHGFGFANALNEIDAGGTALLPLLAGFNIGVELAQLAIVAVVLPLIYAARGTGWYASGVLPFGSCALGAAGIVWMLQRI